jgi:hypothetical protein
MKTKMKIPAILIITIFFASSAMAQDAIQRYFAEYADDPQFSSVVISSKMFQLFSSIDPQSAGGKEFADAISGIRGIRIVASEEVTDGKATFTKVNKKIGAEYEILMSVDEKDEKVRFFIRDEGPVIKELLMLVGGDSKLFIMSISGDIDLKKISALSKSMNVGGMNYLENLNDSKKK